MADRSPLAFIYATLFVIVALGALLRTYSLETIPPGLWRDEARNGTYALQSRNELLAPRFFANRISQPT